MCTFLGTHLDFEGWYEDYFKVKDEIQQISKEAYWKLYLLKAETSGDWNKSFSRGVLLAWNKMEKTICSVTNEHYHKP